MSTFYNAKEVNIRWLQVFAPAGAVSTPCEDTVNVHYCCFAINHEITMQIRKQASLFLGETYACERHPLPFNFPAPRNRRTDGYYYKAVQSDNGINCRKGLFYIIYQRPPGVCACGMQTNGWIRNCCNVRSQIQLVVVTQKCLFVPNSETCILLNLRPRIPDVPLLLKAERGGAAT